MIKTMLNNSSFCNRSSGGKVRRAFDHKKFSFTSCNRYFRIVIQQQIAAVPFYKLFNIVHVYQVRLVYPYKMIFA